MRKKIIAANWKMHMTVMETVSFINTFTLELGQQSDVEVVIAPPFTALAKASELLGNSTQGIYLGAQNMFHETHGAYTGEVAAPMLKELFVRYVILGHSERRQIFGETDDTIRKKVAAAHAAELKPILCVGETLAQREGGRVHEIIERQIRASLEGFKARELLDTVVAYEPVWAIGTGRTATPQQAQEAHATVRRVLAEISDDETAARIRIQYGGSVKTSNAGDLLSQPDIDGALIGGASLDPRGFAQIVKAAFSRE